MGNSDKFSQTKEINLSFYFFFSNRRNAVMPQLAELYYQMNKMYF